MEDTRNALFREKNLQKAASPEHLDGYLKVTGIGPWLALLAAALYHKPVAPLSFMTQGG